MTTPVSVVLVRELPQQVTGSGCCGKLIGQNARCAPGDPFAEARQVQARFGVYHRAVRAFFSPEQVSIVTVDPRNQLYLSAKLWRDVFVYRPGLRAGLRSLFQVFSPPAVVVNGQVLTLRGVELLPDDLCHHIRTLL